MKKKYSNPSIEVIKIQTVGMLAESLGYGTNVNNTSGACSRMNDIDWEEDEDIDY